MQIGSYTVSGRVLLAPMAGVSDAPFRTVCRRFGAALTTTEMVTSNTRLWGQEKSKRRLAYFDAQVDAHIDEGTPRSVQIVGADPLAMADAARECVDHGAEIIDINMGCPAKKVCSVAAGSALLKDEAKVAQILEAVVSAVNVPVTLKIRTGWDQNHRNGVTIAKIAESAGIQALAVHGRTRACAFVGDVEYDTIAAIKASIKIPVIANGDIDTPAKAKQVLDYTGADAVMIGRAAQGRPWIFREIEHFLKQGSQLPGPSATEIRDTICEHLRELHRFYGELMGVRVARKHIGWYLQSITDATYFRHRVNQITEADVQLAMVTEFLDQYFLEGEKAA